MRGSANRKGGRMNKKWMDDSATSKWTRSFSSSEYPNVKSVHFRGGETKQSRVEWKLANVGRLRTEFRVRHSRTLCHSFIFEPIHVAMDMITLHIVMTFSVCASFFRLCMQFRSTGDNSSADRSRMDKTTITFLWIEANPNFCHLVVGEFSKKTRLSGFSAFWEFTEFNSWQIDVFTCSFRSSPTRPIQSMNFQRALNPKDCALPRYICEAESLIVTVKFWIVSELAI
jgi:hypothetical protein